MEEIALSVELRDGCGKGQSRRVRRVGRIPGVFYGPKSTAVTLAVDGKEFATRVANVEGSHLIRLRSPAPALQDKVVLLREVQSHPVSGEILHVDFYEVDLSKRLQVTVPLHFVGKAAGVAEGGILQPILREIEIECLPTDIPQYIEVDVSELGIHDALHIADVKPPANVELIFETNETLVTVLPPTVEEVKAAEVPAEGAVVEGAEAVEGETKEQEAGKEPGKGG